MKTLEELHNYLVEVELAELAQELAIVRYKATMWDKYQSENRISYDFTDSIRNPHAHADFFNEAVVPDQHKDAKGATYTGHDKEDIPGTARKGEN